MNNTTVPSNTRPSVASITTAPQERAASNRAHASSTPAETLARYVPQGAGGNASPTQHFFWLGQLPCCSTGGPGTVAPGARLPWVDASLIFSGDGGPRGTASPGQGVLQFPPSETCQCPLDPLAVAKHVNPSLIWRCVPPPRLIRSSKVHSICLAMILLVAERRWIYPLVAELNAWTAAGGTGTSSSKQATTRQRKKSGPVTQSMKSLRCSLHTLAAATWAAYQQVTRLQVVGLAGSWCSVSPAHPGSCHVGSLLTGLQQAASCWHMVQAAVCVQNYLTCKVVVGYI